MIRPKPDIDGPAEDTSFSDSPIPSLTRTVSTLGSTHSDPSQQSDVNNGALDGENSNQETGIGEAFNQSHGISTEHTLEDDRLKRNAVRMPLPLSFRSSPNSTPPVSPVLILEAGSHGQNPKIALGLLLLLAGAGLAVGFGFGAFTIPTVTAGLVSHLGNYTPLAASLVATGVGALGGLLMSHGLYKRALFNELHSHENFDSIIGVHC